MNNNLEIITTRNVVVFIVYTLFCLVIAVTLFKKQMLGDNNY